MLMLRQAQHGAVRHRGKPSTTAMSLPINDDQYLQHAIRLAIEAERRGNLPIGAVITFGGQVISEGMNSIWKPSPDLTRHAEMEALRSLPSHLRPHAREMTLFTTLEPCLMCAGAILLHSIGRVVFGASDPFGGVLPSLDSLPPFFQEQFHRIQWQGPFSPEDCDPLYARVRELERQHESSSR